MKFLIAPSAFKGSFSAAQVAKAIADGINQHSEDNQISYSPIADGGDGTIEALHTAMGGRLHRFEVQGPTAEKVVAQWLEVRNNWAVATTDLESAPKSGSESFLKPASSVSKPAPNDLAIIELASACGLAYLLPDRLAPLDATTTGVGQLIDHCYGLGFRNIAVAVGGSASTDGGIGILTALGAKFYDAAGVPIPPGGRHLGQIKSLNLSALAQSEDRKFTNMRFSVLTDVTNPLLGENGAARIFGPQKGASPAEIEILESGLANYADILEKSTGRAVRSVPGAGAAGGVAFGLAAALGANILPGFQWITGIMNLERRVRDSEVVITAEGSLDSQSLGGKASGELAKMCATYGKPLWIVAGRIEEGIDWNLHGIERAILATKPDADHPSVVSTPTKNGAKKRVHAEPNTNTKPSSSTEQEMYASLQDITHAIANISKELV